MRLRKAVQQEQRWALPAVAHIDLDAVDRSPLEAEALVEKWGVHRTVGARMRLDTQV
jgi:hypothetical protein